MCNKKVLKLLLAKQPTEAIPEIVNLKEISKTYMLMWNKKVFLLLAKQPIEAIPEIANLKDITKTYILDD